MISVSTKTQTPLTYTMAGYTKKPEPKASPINVSSNNNKPFTSEHLKATFLTFGKMRNPLDYDRFYNVFDEGYNGKFCDSFIFDKVTQLLPIKEGDVSTKKVLDLGAGDGRNAIPIAKAGYNVTTVESSSSGRILIRQKSRKADVENKITIKKTDILNKQGLDLKDYDLAFMDHVSQHFTEPELDKAFSNISQSLKPGAYFVFDALIKQYYKENEEINPEAELSGFYNFNNDFIKDLIEKYNFEIVEPPPDYDEPAHIRAEYVNSSLWGNAPYSPYNLNVKLKWFVLRKKSEHPKGSNE